MTTITRQPMESLQKEHVWALRASCVWVLYAPLHLASLLLPSPGWRRVATVHDVMPPRSPELLLNSLSFDHTSLPLLVLVFVVCLSRRPIGHLRGPHFGVQHSSLCSCILFPMVAQQLLTHHFLSLHQNIITTNRTR